jgi:hypothetical protein
LTLSKYTISRSLRRTNAQTRGIQSLAAEHNITKHSAHNWLRKRWIQGYSAYRRSRKLSERLGRQPKLTYTQIRRLLYASNPVRNQNNEHQIQQFELRCGICALQDTLHCSMKNGRHFRSIQVKQLSKSDKKKRRKYSQERQIKTVDDF